MSSQKYLIIEPFYGGSHKQLLDALLKDFNETDYLLLTLPAKKWHWRARTSALYFSQIIPKDVSYKTLLCSSVLNLTELIGLCPHLHTCKKIIYFHENQLIYPVEYKKERDFQYGYNQIISCLTADKVIFNSEYNKNSFLSNIQKHLKMQPGIKFQGLEEQIIPKCSVLYFPVVFDSIPKLRVSKEQNLPIHIVWPHRWEHDKNPELFLETMMKMKENNIQFRLSVLGEHTTDVPEIFNKAKEILVDNIINFGYAESKEKYYEVLLNADIVVSTAKHEFFGVAMIEGTYCGCLPIAPNSLVYPEIYPKECLYNTSNQLYKLLTKFCKYPKILEETKIRVFETFSFSKYDSNVLIPAFRRLLD
ncbi:glycosyltransferase-like domain-containing protein 1 [Ctenocephalides felis]|uniref:glycosyltransferase-like domain-containing protein 1 n=1 Tax=Ctenocephalides felis TaxID=7515 RepID=UPI000E6E1D64|nr:glycosyltransferase-like domain-containing protein 1 [Ctenocephalides felis]